ncbi:Aste57867_21473 [Aphanomyces stellatus]|uniref:Aste57867_21473 protein n=1 Tax=Aphanomyces stellatus TaxID=120398 RepID=A0A485LHJ6_9STRA|nr:hypothetical protein As57867_021404 [Aphanomyces stellatus]VFT98143.1 Aste57867_21473 [Aphanomyces stellatus]
MDESWAAAAWNGLVIHGWEEMELSENSFFYASPEFDSIDAFEMGATAFGSKLEAAIYAIQNTSVFQDIRPFVWEHMRSKLGWRILVRQGKAPWYVKPQVTVGDLKPRVNLFETEIDAVEVFLESVMPFKRKQVTTREESPAKRRKACVETVESPEESAEPEPALECTEEIVSQPTIDRETVKDVLATPKKASTKETETIDLVSPGPPTMAQVSTPRRSNRTMARSPSPQRSVAPTMTQVSTPRRSTRSNVRSSSPQPTVVPPMTPKRQSTPVEVKTPKRSSPRLSETIATPKRTTPRTPKQVATPSTIESTKRNSPRTKLVMEPTTPKKASTSSAAKQISTPGKLKAKSTWVDDAPTSPCPTVTKSSNPKTPTKVKQATPTSDAPITTTSALYLKNLSTKLSAVQTKAPTKTPTAAKEPSPLAQPTTPRAKKITPMTVTSTDAPAAGSQTPKKSRTKSRGNSMADLLEPAAPVISVTDTTPSVPPQTPKKTLTKSRGSNMADLLEPTDVATPVTPKKKSVTDKAESFSTPAKQRANAPTPARTPVKTPTMASRTPQRASMETCHAASPMLASSVTAPPAARTPVKPVNATAYVSPSNAVISPGASLAVHLPPKTKSSPLPLRVAAPTKLPVIGVSKLKNQTQLDSINSELLHSAVSPVNMNSIHDLLGFGSPAPAPSLTNTVSPTSTVATDCPIDEPSPASSSNWSMGTPVKKTKRVWSGDAGSGSATKKRRNAALISSLMDTPPQAAATDDSMASFLEETVRDDEPSPIPAKTSPLVTQSSARAVYKSVGMDDILNGAMGRLIEGKQSSPPSSSSSSTTYVTPHIPHKTHSRSTPKMQPGKEMTFRARVVQEFKNYGWKIVAPNMFDKGSQYSYTHDKLKDQKKYTRDELAVYAEAHDIFTNPKLMEPSLVVHALNRGSSNGSAGKRKVIKSVKPRPSSDWSATKPVNSRPASTWTSNPLYI